MTTPRVLLVEDNNFTRSTVAAGLRAEGCRVHSVATAREAVSTALDTPPDCAVIDLHLGRGPSGIDVAHGLREQNPDVGIVLLTSFADPRFMSEDQRELPTATVYAVKNDLDSTSQLRACVDEAITAARTHQNKPRGAPGTTGTIRVPLTDTQVEILRLLAQGLTNAEIARRRVTSERTVEITIARIVKGLDLQPTDTENSRVLLTQAYFELIGGGGVR